LSFSLVSRLFLQRKDNYGIFLLCIVIFALQYGGL